MRIIRGAVRFYLLLAAIFVLLLLLIPTSSGEVIRYQVTPANYRLLFFLLEVPLIFIWAVSLYSYLKLKQYAELIADSPESSGYANLARGCQWLTWGLPISAIASILLTTISRDDQSLLPKAIIMSNYISLLFPVLAFTYMSRGSEALLSGHYDLAKQRHKNRLIQIVFIAVGLIYSFLILKNFGASELGSSANQYYLPVWLVVISLIIPYLYAWFLGLLTVFDIISLTKFMPGILYRRAMRLMASGLVIIIGSLMSVQYIHSFVPDSHDSMRRNIIVAYLIYLVIIAGFVLLALGVRKMQRIEEV
jgi:hypothetical protein